MFFDVQLQIKVNIQPAKPGAGLSMGYAHIRVLGDTDRPNGVWQLLGKQDNRLPKFGNTFKEWVWANKSTGRIALMHNGKAWAWLDSFPTVPKISSSGIGYAFRLPVGPSRTLPNGHYILEWGVIEKARHGNLPTIDPKDGAFENLLRSCTTDTGWRYETSAGLSGALGAVVGGGLINGYLVLKRKEPNDARQWKVDISAVGIGLMSPTAGASGSSEETYSKALCNVMAGPDIALPFPVSDFGGTVIIFEGSGGLAAGKGKVGIGRSGAMTTYMFTGVTAQQYSLGDFTQVKAILVTKSLASGGGKGQGLSAAGIWYGGVASVSQYK